MARLDITSDTLFKYFSNQASKEEIDSILSWLDENSTNKIVFAKEKKMFIELSNSISNSKEKGTLAFSEFEKKMDATIEKKEKKSFKISNNIFIRYSAVIAVILSLTVIAYITGKTNSRISTKNNLYTINVPYGGKSSVTLPDGSVVHLNAGSKLKYYENFGLNSRYLYLQGEGLFEVKKHKYPMVVHTSHIDIEVLGTVFNVKSYDDENNIETTLLEGSIKVKTPGEKLDSPIYLKPNEKLVYNKSNSNIVINNNTNSADKQKDKAPLQKALLKKKFKITSNVDVYASVAWKDGKYIFTGETLEELAIILTRKFDITFTFESEKMKDLTYSGTLRDYPIEQVLEALSLTSPVSYQIKEKNVYLTLDNEKLKTYNKLMNN